MFASGASLHTRRAPARPPGNHHHQTPPCWQRLCSSSPPKAMLGTMLPDAQGAECPAGFLCLATGMVPCPEVAPCMGQAALLGDPNTRGLTPARAYLPTPPAAALADPGHIHRAVCRGRDVRRDVRALPARLCLRERRAPHMRPWLLWRRQRRLPPLLPRILPAQCKCVSGAGRGQVHTSRGGGGDRSGARQRGVSLSLIVSPTPPPPPDATTCQCCAAGMFSTYGKASCDACPLDEYTLGDTCSATGPERLNDCQV